MTVPAVDSPEAGTTELLIDTDVHEMLSSKRDLAPYLAGHWRNVIETYFYDASPLAPNSGWMVTAPSTGARTEWLPPRAAAGEGSAAATAAGTRLDLLQEHLFEQEGVTAAILNGFFYPSCFPAHFEFATALATAYNDWQIDNWIERDPRLYGSVHVVTADPQQAAREIDRVAQHPRIVQVLIPTTLNRQYGDPIYRPIFEAAARNDLVVAMHQSPATETALGIPRTVFEWHTLAAPQAAMSHLTSILAGGIFDLFPTLKLAILEASFAWLPWYLWRADENYREYRWDIPWVKRLPSEHVRSNVRFATQPLGEVQPHDLLKLVELVESDELFMFSTDYPHYDADSADAVLPRTLPETLRRKIRFENALATYPRLAHLRSEAA